MNRREFLNRTKRTSLGLAAGLTHSGRCPIGAGRAGQRQALAGDDGRPRPGPPAGQGLSRSRRLPHRLRLRREPGRRPTAGQGVRRSPARQSAKVVQDFRSALDDKSVDALVVATPDHWHCLATILACQAGKDVYVEKPLSHDPGKAARRWRPRESTSGSCRWARRTARPVQHGRQEIPRGGQTRQDSLLPGVQSEVSAEFPRRARRPSARRLRLGHVQRPGARVALQHATTSTIGTTTGDIRAATSPTTASTSWTWPAGCWA